MGARRLTILSKIRLGTGFVLLFERVRVEQHYENRVRTAESFKITFGELIKSFRFFCLEFSHDVTSANVIDVIKYNV